MRTGVVGTIVVMAVSGLLVGCGTGRQMARMQGRDLYKTCVPCHGTNGGGSLELRTPAIAGLPDWYLRAELRKFAGNIRGAHPDDSEGHRMRPMARWLYPPGAIEAVAAYVSQLPPVDTGPAHGGDVTAGQATYTTVCFICHGADGKGNIDLGSPPITGQPHWYLVSQLKKFKSGMRGTHPDDTTGTQMRAMTMSLQDTTAMHDVVAYIKSLPR